MIITTIKNINNSNNTKINSCNNINKNITIIIVVNDKYYSNETLCKLHVT